MTRLDGLGLDEAGLDETPWEEDASVGDPREVVVFGRRSSRDPAGRIVRVRGGTPVTPLGGPERVDLRHHPRATLVGIIAVVVLYIVGSFALGMLLREGESTVSVPRVQVPRLDGRTLEEASKDLGEMGLLVAVEYQSNETAPEGMVFGQRPVAGSKLEVGTEVTLVVSDGRAGLKVPDVAGFQGAEAAKLLQATGFAPTIEQAYDDEVRPGEVLRTDPAAGARADTGAPVRVIVSNGPAPRVVPPVVDQPIAQGFAQLGRSGLGLASVSTEVVEGKAPGVILSTDPPAGASAPPGTPVAVTVTEAAPELVVPSVTGLLQASARTALADSGLVVMTWSQTVPFDDARAGRVIAQSVPAGTTVSSGTPLQLTIAVAAAPPTTTTVPQASTTTVP